jgi:hypothetical protein
MIGGTLGRRLLIGSRIVGQPMAVRRIFGHGVVLVLRGRLFGVVKAVFAHNHSPRAFKPPAERASSEAQPRLAAARRWAGRGASAVSVADPALQRATIVGKSKSLFFSSAAVVAALHCASVA